MLNDIIQRIRPSSMDALLPKGTFDVANATGAEWASTQYSYYWALARLFRPTSILEIGVLGGVSMASMLLGAGPQCHAVGWDIEGYHKDSNKLAAKTLNACGLSGRYTLHRTNSQKLPSFPREHDLIHVDGEHGLDGALRDLELSMACGCSTILFDDIFNPSADCKAAADEFLKRNAARVVYSEIMPTTTGLMVFKLSP